MEGEGGQWTITKLSKVREYLIRYQEVMLNQKWVETVYIDAFCGSGRVKLRGARDFTEGSALQAIALDRPFSKYHLIEKSKSSLTRLRQQIELQHSDRNVSYHSGDVNELLPVTVSALKSHERAVIFADPYGMQLKWSTIEAIAKVPRCDFWLLVPTGIGLMRLATRDPRRRTPAWEKRLDDFLGEHDWRTRWYESTGQANLFDDTIDVARTADLNRMTEDFRKRLSSAFPCVADNVLHLKNGNHVLFTLMFACSNTSPKAKGIAKSIANHLLKE
jgi:three-Cys-motif partner protein